MLSRLLFACSLTLFSGTATVAESPEHWVGTWAASPLAQNNASGKFGTGGSNGSTLREIVHISLGGSTFRVAFTNEFGLNSLTLGPATLAVSAGGSNVSPSAAMPLTFHGSNSVTIPPGAMILSDPVKLRAAPLSDLAVSFFLPDQTINQITVHSLGNQTNYVAPGNSVNAASLDGAKEVYSWHFLKGVDVQANAASSAVVTLGDSITDGAHTTRNANARWPDVLAKRLQADKKTANLSVLNAGISGNRLLHDVAGPSALARFDRDVLALPGVRYLIVLEGINDIGRTAQPREPGDPVTTDQLLFAMQQIIDRAHAHGIKVYGATLSPYGGAAYSSPDGLKMRQAENDFIRSGKFDGFVDFDKATQDPANPEKFLPANDSGDHLHPNDAGYKAMGDAIDLKLFEK